MQMYTVLLIKKIGALREGSENYAKPAIAVFLNSLTLPNTLVVRLPGVPGSPRRTRRRLPGVPGSKKKFFFFFKMFNGKDSDMLVVIVGQYCSA